MLGTYFTIILALFIAMVVGAVLGYSGNLESNIKSPLLKALNEYDDNPGDTTPQDAAKKALKSVWNEVQEEVSYLRTSHHNLAICSFSSSAVGSTTSTTGLRILKKINLISMLR